MMKYFTFVTLMILGACGPLAQSQPTALVFDGFVRLAGDALGNRQDGSDVVTREAIDASLRPLALFAPVNSENAKLFAAEGQNGTVVTWLSEDGDSLALRNGLIVATRGLGNDLMGSNASQLYASILDGRGQYVRVHDYLDGEDQIVQSRLQCNVEFLRDDQIEIFGRTFTTRLIRENCTGANTTFQNLYWIDGVGLIRQSRQWVGARVGLVDIQLL